jgi:hypothetical protein
LGFDNSIGVGCGGKASNNGTICKMKVY